MTVRPPHGTGRPYRVEPRSSPLGPRSSVAARRSTARARTPTCDDPPAVVATLCRRGVADRHRV